MDTHEEYTKLIKERYEHLRNQSYEMMGDYDWALLAPESYCVETPMLSYVKKHPNASLREICKYFSEITPPGLAPGDDGADLLED